MLAASLLPVLPLNSSYDVARVAGDVLKLMVEHGEMTFGRYRVTAISLAFPPLVSRETLEVRPDQGMVLERGLDRFRG